ncbi:isoprenyl transferase [soil metagenome]
MRLLERTRTDRLHRDVRRARLPRHVGLVMDGNRRWARAAGLDARAGHRAGAEHVADVLRWSEEVGIDHLTVYVLSADNIRRRGSDEIGHLMTLLETVVPDAVLSRDGHWRLHVSGDLTLLPASTRAVLDDAVEQTANGAAHLTLAVAYDGRADIAHAVRRAVLEGGAADVDDITRCLAGGPVKDIDLVIRTSGETRLSGFFPWQSAGARLHLSPRMWPAFTHADFLRALLSYDSTPSQD